MTLSNHQSRRRYIWGSVAVVVLVALIIVLVTQGRAAAEAQKHDPHGQAAATARSQADFELVKALDDVANQLSWVRRWQRPSSTPAVRHGRPHWTSR